MDRERELWVKATEDRSLWFGGRRPPDLETPVARSPLYHVEASVLRSTICSSLEPVPGIFTGVYTVSTRADLCGLDISTPDPAMQQRVEIKVGEPLLSAHWERCKLSDILPRGERAPGWNLEQIRSAIVYSTIADAQRGYLFLSENKNSRAVLSVSKCGGGGCVVKTLKLNVSRFADSSANDVSG